MVPGDYVMVAVTDSGTGMTPETAAQVFEPFFTTKETGQGTGLGLSMVYGFTKQSGGHVNIYSEPGLGTTVKLYFPRVEPPAEGGSGHGSENTERPKGNERILVVEDDADVRDALAGMLELLGYSAVMARDGAEALRRLEEHDDFALLLTDVVMPGGMSGPELAEEVAARRPGIKVLFTSGYAAKALRRREDSLTGANWLAKPYTINHLARRLRDVLDEENGT